jgi:formate dehydrogenase major subunit
VAISLPLFDQLRGDLTARGAAARSRRSAALEPRTKTADRVAKSICP